MNRIKTIVLNVVANHPPTLQSKVALIRFASYIGVTCDDLQADVDTVSEADVEDPFVSHWMGHN